MPSTTCASIAHLESLQQLACRRMEYTAEKHQSAVDALKALAPGAPPIPTAACDGQAQMETQILESMRGILSLNSPYPLGICSITPRPESLTIVLDCEPYVVRAWAERLLPFDPGPENDVYGLSGLRYRVGHHQVHLTVDDGTHRGQVILSGFPVRWWEESVSALLAAEKGGATACWLQRGGEWTDRERFFHEGSKWPTCDYRIGSGLLRRMGLTRFTEGYGGTEVWSDPAGRDGWRWRLEMLRGPDDSWLLHQLCDPEFGLPFQAESHHCNCDTRGGCSTTLRSTSTPPQTLYITDLRWPVSPDKRKAQAERQAKGNERAFLPQSFNLL